MVLAKCLQNPELMDKLVVTYPHPLIDCLFVGLVQLPANSSMSSFQTAQGHAFRKLFHAAGAVTESMR